MDEQMIRAAREIDAVPILPRDCDGGMTVGMTERQAIAHAEAACADEGTVDLAAAAAGFHPDERIGIVEDVACDGYSADKARADHERYMHESRCKKPSINVNVYITSDEVIDACHHDNSELNPFCIRFGAQYDTTQTVLHMSKAQMERLYHAIGAALQDYELTR